MKTFLRHISLLLLIAFAFNTNAQRLDYETDSGFDIGFGIGGTYQASELKSNSGYGFDFTFGHSLYQKEEAFWSLDWRFRYLRGENFSDITNPDLGLTNDKLRFDVNQYDLEFVLTMNKLRNKTGIILAGFAGGGFMHNRVFINGKKLKPSERTGLDSLRKTDLAILPTAGFYIGYQFGPRFSMGIEHKYTFALSEKNNLVGPDMDYTQSAGGSLDINNYTALGFKWDIGKGGGSGGVTPTGGNTTSSYTPEKPKVNITDPLTNPYKTTINTHVIKAKVYHVGSHSDITFDQDGMRNMSFTFNPNTNDFEATVQLKRGGNTFRIFGKNMHGSDEDNVTIILDDAVSQIPPPDVDIYVPQANPYTTDLSVVDILSSTLNVNKKEDISFTVNGIATAFNFINKKVQAKISLAEGANTVVITGVNTVGSDTDTQTIIYNKPDQILPPTVNITNPGVNPYNTQNNTHFVVAKTTQLTLRSQLSVKVNNLPVSDFQFNSNTGVVRFNANLNIGQNIVTTTGTNEAGTAKDQTIIIYKKPIRLIPPVVTVLIPEVSPYNTFNNAETVKANVLNVALKNQIRVSVNGVNTTNFTYNATKKLVSLNVNLKEGKNGISITATNKAGSDTDSQIIFKEIKPCPQPTLALEYPKQSVFKTDNQSHTAIIKTQNATHVQVLYKNYPYSNFQFDKTSGVLKIPMNLSSGGNPFKVIATNDCGEKTLSFEMVYDEIIDTPCNTPSITFSKTPNAEVNAPGVKIEAKVVEIYYANQINLLVNGVKVPSVFNRGNVIADVLLKKGENNIKLIVTNDCGSDTKLLNVKFTPIVIEEEPCDVPVVEFNVTKNDGNDATHILNGTVTNIKNKTDVKVTVDGKDDNGFSFVPNTTVLNTKFKLEAGTHKITVTATNECGTDTKTVTVTVEEEVIPCDVPVVEFNVTKNDGNDATHILNGTVTNIKNKTDVKVTVDGKDDNGFSFVPNTTVLNTKFKLEAGTHKITVTATNECGTDTKTVTVTVEEEVIPCDVPVVKFNVTENDGNDATHILNGTVTNIKNKTDVKVTVDGKDDNGFSFVPNTTVLNTKFKLEAGTHKITVTATNECGTDTKTVTVTVEEEVIPCDVPVVEFNVTKNDGNDATHILNGTVTNIKNKTDVKVTVDGKDDNGFSFVPNTTVLNTKFKLEAGTHKITVTATNECGTDTKTVTVTVEEEVIPCDVPVVEFNVTKNDGNDATHILNGTVTNIKNKTDVKVTVDGKDDNGFSFVPNTTVLNTKFKLEAGTHKITVTATNECGTDTKTVTVTVEEEVIPCDVPVVEFNVTKNDGNDATHILNGTVTNIKNKTDVKVTVDGKDDNGFSFVPNTTVLNTKFKLEAGTHKITVTATNECGTDTKTVTVTVEEEVIPCDVPVVKFNVTENDGNDATHILNGTVTNIKNKTDVKVTVDGKEDNGFSFMPNTTELNTKFKLSAGTHKITVTATNECGSDTKTVTVTVEEEVTPCDAPTVIINSQEVKEANASHKIYGTIDHTSGKNDISFIVNGKSNKNFTMDSISFEALVDLPSGTNTITVNATTTCGNDSQTITIDVEEEQCGPRFNPGNSAWEFCLITPSGAYTRDNLKNNSNFTYSGSASSLYFKPIAGGGDALVNGQPYTVQSGSYYLFEGQLTVSVSNSHPGSMGQWMVCVDANSTPIFGNGANRPKSPCEATNTGNGNGNGGGNSGNNGSAEGNNGNGNSGGNGSGERGESSEGDSNAAQQKASQEAEAKKQAEEQERVRAQEEARKKAAIEAQRKKQAAEAARKKQIEEARRKAAAEAQQKRAAEQARVRAEANRKAQEEARKKAAVEAQRKTQAAEVARKKKAEEVKRKAAAEAARKRAEIEAAKKKATESNTRSVPAKTKTNEEEDSTKKPTPKKGTGRIPK